jgi:hypothetical protein
MVAQFQKFCLEFYMDFADSGKIPGSILSLAGWRRLAALRFNEDPRWSDFQRTKGLSDPRRFWVANACGDAPHMVGV